MLNICQSVSNILFDCLSVLFVCLQESCLLKHTSATIDLSLVNKLIFTQILIHRFLYYYVMIIYRLYNLDKYKYVFKMFIAFHKLLNSTLIQHLFLKTFIKHLNIQMTVHVHIFKPSKHQNNLSLESQTPTSSHLVKLRTEGQVKTHSAKVLLVECLNLTRVKTR